MKTSVLRYHKQTDSLRKVSLSLSKMETEHPPGTQVSLEPSVHVCLISQGEVHSIKASRDLQASFWDKVTPPLKNLQPYFTHKNKNQRKAQLVSSAGNLPAISAEIAWSKRSLLL